jgi:hypothetical protein
MATQSAELGYEVALQGTSLKGGNNGNNGTAKGLRPHASLCPKFTTR